MPLWTLARESKDKENGFEGRGEGVRIPEKTTEGQQAHIDSLPEGTTKGTE